MNKIQEEKLVPIVVNLAKPDGQLNESFLKLFGTAVKLLIKRIFGLNNFPFQVRGNRTDIESFMKTVAQEATYMRALRKHGLQNSATLSSKSTLDSAVRSFESETGIVWPFK